MTKDELLKKCVDRGVADKNVVESVSHLLYVYLLSALQKGQRVEVPGFGTFGTRVVGVKRARRIPFFEADVDFSERVNERYKSLKSLVLGTYHLIPAIGEVSYKGRDEQPEMVTEMGGKEIVLDTRHEASVEEFENAVRQVDEKRQTKEKPSMPQFNLKDEATEGGVKQRESETTPRLREAGAGQGGGGMIGRILLGVAVLALIAVGLQYFGIIKFWGTGPQTGDPTTPATETVAPPKEEAPPPAVVTPTPRIETPTPVRSQISPGTGNFTVQVSSWISRGKATEEADRLSAAGMSAFVEEGIVDGTARFRVRVGRYATRREAAENAARLSEQLEDGAWVTRVGL